MLVWVAEVEALATAGPTDPAFDGDAAGFEMLLPRTQFRKRDRKGQVERAFPVVRRDRPAGSRNRLESGTALEQQQDVAVGDTQSAEAIVRAQLSELQSFLVELNSALKVVHIEARLDHSGHFGHGRSSLD